MKKASNRTVLTLLACVVSSFFVWKVANLLKPAHQESAIARGNSDLTLVGNVATGPSLKEKSGFRNQDPAQIMLGYDLERRERVRFNADEVVEDLEGGTITLKGHAWWRLDDSLVEGQHDSNSVIVLDAKTLQVISRSSEVFNSLLIR